MTSLLRRPIAALSFAVAVILTLAMALAVTPSPAAASDAPYRVLVFSKTAGFRHDSIPAGIQMIQNLGTANNFTVDATEDATAFTTTNLARYQAVVFLSTTGDVLDGTQQTAFESYIGAGGGYVGIHAAADTEYSWPFYGSLMGAWFASHPAIQPVTVRVEDRAHAATAGLPQSWVRTDELYNYQTNPRANVKVLATLDESTYSGGTMGTDHPITWCHPYAGGRAFYTGLGHTTESYSEANFINLVLGGIRYASGRAQADCRPENGYTDLDNGSLAGWSQAGPGSMGNTDATLSTNGGLGLLWYSAKKFGSYSLKLDWKLSGDDNSGVYVGIPDGSDPVNDAINKGYEIQLDATDTPDRTTGSIYGFQAADQAARDGALNPPGAWNTYEIVVTGQNIQVFLNGVKINDFTNVDPGRDISHGYIGLQEHSAADHVSFRHVRIAESGPTTGDTTIQAESFSATSGLQTYPHTPAHGGQVAGFVDPGDWAAYSGVDLTGATSFTARVASPGPTGGGGFAVRVGSPTGQVLGSGVAPATGGWETYQDVSFPLAGAPAGSQTLYLTFTGGGFDVDDFTIHRTAAPPLSAFEAESFTSQNGGVQVVAHTNASAGQTVGYIDNGDWVGYSGVATNGASAISARVASAGIGGSIQVRAGSASGTLLGTLAVPVTGSWETFTTVSTTLTTAGAGPLFLVFSGGSGALFDVDTVSLTTLLSQGRPATSSSNENAALAPGNAVDGNGTTRWSSAFSDPQWIQVDLGAVRTVSRILLQWEAAYGRAYQLQTSTDGATWSTIYSTTTGDGGSDDLAVTGSGRYVRLYGTARGTVYGYSLYEFQVFGA